MLSKSNNTTRHVKNIQKLMIQFYKYLDGLIMKEVFTKRLLKYNLQNCRATFLSNPKTKKYSSGTVVYKAAQPWSTLPIRYKIFLSLDLFKFEIKN